MELEAIQNVTWQRVLRTPMRRMMQLVLLLVLIFGGSGSCFPQTNLNFHTYFLPWAQEAPGSNPGAPTTNLPN
jgi:hypothetical protein